MLPPPWAGPPAARQDDPVLAREDLARANLPRAGLLAAIGLVVLLAATVLSIGLGARDIAPLDVIDIVLHPDGDSYGTHVLWTERIPRTFLGLLVGAALGASGLIMQALTLNPLADPGILGVEVGAAFFVVIGVVGFGVTGMAGYFWFALLGAALTAAVVYLLGTRSAAGGSSLGLVLAGAAISALLASLITLVVVRDAATSASLNSWSVGQLTGRGGILGEALPFLAIAIIAALPLGRSLNVLALGEDAAAGLGLRVGRAQLISAAVAVLLCAAATAACGPIAFVGLVSGHVARMLVGTDHRAAIPFAMATGAGLLVIADVGGRLIPGSGEMPVGIMTAIVGVPFFVWLARRRHLVTL